MEWRSIEGFDNYYVNDEGAVLSFYPNQNSRIMRQHKSDKRYMRVTLKKKNGRYDTQLVHRLVAKAFIPNPDNLPQVNHKNGNKADNRVENLEWVTSSDNIRHAYDVIQIESGAKGKHFKRKAKLLPIEVRIIRQTDIPNVELAHYLGITDSAISKIRSNRSYKYIT